MSIFLRSIRLTKFSSSARYNPHTTKWRAPQSISHFSKMNSTSSAFQTSFEEGGNTGGPKQQSQLRDIKLNDGNEIPVVSSIFKSRVKNAAFLTLGQLGYGLGTARYKDDPSAPIDKELVKTVVMAIKAGYYHLDGAQGILYLLSPLKP